MDKLGKWIINILMSATVLWLIYMLLRYGDTEYF